METPDVPQNSANTRKALVIAMRTTFLPYRNARSRIARRYCELPVFASLIMVATMLALTLTATLATGSPQTALAATLTTGSSQTELSTSLAAGSETKPAKPVFVVCKSKTTGQATIKVRKIAGATGYRFKIARNKSLSKSVKLKTAKRRWTRFENLVPGKVYYVRVRAYKLVNGKKIWGARSVIKRIQVQDAPIYQYAASSNATSITRMRTTLAKMAAWQMPYANSNSLETIISLLDPKNVIPNSPEFYQFAKLKGYSGLSAAQINRYITSTAAGRTGKLRGKGAYFVAAAKKYHVNECYLVAHAILESGWGNSKLAKGFRYNGKVYYNFYGIGAYDGNALSGGRGAAVKYGWVSPKAAIMGAARFVSQYYLNRSQYPQYTLYGMKWDYLYSSQNLEYGWHQYATDPYWPSTISILMNECYSYNRYNPSLTYAVPKYR